MSDRAGSAVVLGASSSVPPQPLQPAAIRAKPIAMNETFLLERIMWLIPLVLSLTVHEWAHAYSAFRLGDDTAARMGRLPLWLDDTPAISILDLRAKIRRLQAELRNNPNGPTELGLVAIDYLQLMSGRKGVSSREQEISEISRGLKQLAKEMGVPLDKINVNGGSIAMGHPIGATGAIILGTLLDELERRQLRYGVATLCVAGGMGVATVIERI